MVNESVKNEFFHLRDKIIERQYMSLNPEQREAVMTISGQLLIIAGAGSGKTTVLVNRMNNMLTFGTAYKSQYWPKELEEQDVESMKEYLDILEEDKKAKLPSYLKELLGYNKIFPYQILAITFTNKAAGEMRERVRRIAGDEVDNMWISTFHSTCVRILRREIDKLGYTSNFTIYDTSDAKTLMKKCMKDLSINDKDLTEGEILNKIGRAKDNLITAEEYKKLNGSDYKLNKIADAYLEYQKRLKANNALDFDDIINKTVELFKKYPEVLEFYGNKFRYIMIDEYQDTNRAQYEFVTMIASKHKNICVVGDEDQCIYAWRGADITNILNFEKDYPGAKVIKLERNYRSYSNILDAANSVIKNNTQRKDKVLRSSKDSGEKLKLYRAYSDREECDFVYKTIEDLKNKQNLTYKDFAILYRTNNQSRLFEDIFIKKNVPYRLVGGLRFYERKEIKDIIAYLRVLNNPMDDVALQRIINVPKRNIGDATVLKLMDFANQTEDGLYNTILDIETVPGMTARNVSSISRFRDIMEKLMIDSETVSISELIKRVWDESGYMQALQVSGEIEDESRIENLMELVSAAAEFEERSEDKSLQAFLEENALSSDIDNYDDESDAVVLMTVHSAKGLEFPVVFMVGMENGLFPSQMAMENPYEMEEARRLCYVAITRAKNELYITSAKNRFIYGKTVCYEPSIFIEEINKDLLEDINGASKANATSKTQNPFEKKASYMMSDSFTMMKKAQEATSKTFSSNAKIAMGKKVKHPKFGIGTIVRIVEDGGDSKLTIAFDSMGIKTMLLSIAPLEIL